MKKEDLCQKTIMMSMNLRCVLTVMDLAVYTATRLAWCLLRHPKSDAGIAKASDVYIAGLPAGIAQKENMTDTLISSG